mmetsp:Transcript_45759/g.118263  ORF Transcript_45759/g.118263 Transcript_45759/m.118263 type:complete len:485 (-) Transcript_45759:125-1579(-)
MKRKIGMGSSHAHARPKRVFRKASDAVASFDSTLQLTRGSHPRGITPLGNLWLSDEKRKQFVVDRMLSLGRFAYFPDELLGEVLSYLDAAELATLCCTSKYFYIFGTQEDFWRPLVLSLTSGSFDFARCWKETYAVEYVKKKGGAGEQWTPPPADEPYLQVAMPSDVLFRPWYCASVSISPTWLKGNNVARIPASDLSVTTFVEEYERPLKPIVISGAAMQWKAYEKWSDEYLIEKGGDKTFIAGEANITMAQYFKYARQAVEEKPLYIFDKSFVRTCPQLGEDYKVFDYFSDDLFSLMGEDRPEYRWLIIGPQRSGSNFHVDPNSTNAWNALVRGRKKWIMFPPHITPPGVHPSSDMGTVTSPVSLMEWFLNYYAQAKATGESIEFIQEEGDLVFVPSGWWHAVLNIEDTIAVTQNYVSPSNVHPALEFLEVKREQVSGCGCRGARLYEIFRDALKEKRPEVYDEHIRIREERVKREEERKKR